MEYPVSTSVSVSVSIGCTPGASARKSILTDWHVDGFSGLARTGHPSLGVSARREQ